LTREDVEEMMADATRLAATLGFTSMEHFEEFKYYAGMGLLKFGGSFAQKLGECLAVADLNNSIKLIRLVDGEMYKQAILYKMFEAKQNALSEENSSEQPA